MLPKELLALRNNFRATKKFLIAKFDCTYLISRNLAFNLVKQLIRLSHTLLHNNSIFDTFFEYKCKSKAGYNI